MSQDKMTNEKKLLEKTIIEARKEFADKFNNEGDIADKILSAGFRMREEFTEDEIKDIGIDLVDKHFPKGECKERGQAIVLYAEIVIRILAKLKGV